MIKSDFIGAVIGPGGKIIQEIQANTNTEISIDEKDNMGIVEISGKDQAGIDEAIRRVKEITFEPEIGETYTGKVISIKPFGAFVELKRGTEGLVHISELEWHRVNNVEDVVNIGDIIEVKYLENDKKTGKMRLSRKVLLPKPEKKNEE